MTEAASQCECPRCGYDQSGAIAAWERNEPACCPLTGKCTECGLEFAWRDLLNPVYSRELRLFEHALSHLLASFTLTLWRAQRGWSFWRWVRMENRIVPRRLVLFLALGLPAAYFGAALLLGLFGAVDLGISRLWTWYTGGWPRRGGFDGGSWFARAIWPLGDWDGFGGHIFSPLALIAILTVSVIPVTFVLLPQTLRSARVRKAHVLRVTAYAWVALPLVLALSRLAIGVVMMVCFLDVPLARLVLWGLAKYEWWVLLGLVCVWLASWWAWGAGRYMRLPKPWAIGGLMTVLSLLASSLIVLALSDVVWFFENV